jgi:hypothetical protein
MGRVGLADVSVFFDAPVLLIAMVRNQQGYTQLRTLGGIWGGTLRLLYPI